MRARLLGRLKSWPDRFAFFTAVGLAAVVMSPLLIGIEPIGGDPDRMYRPIKTELARALGEGRLPLWSDRFGLGVPLAAESHVAAFYPPNILLYGLLDVATAYRISMWLHFVALTALTYAYARCLGATSWGSAMSATAFTFSGFLSIHSSHEWSYHTLPYMILVLIAADRLMHSGNRGWLGVLALAWGLQLTLGHFQIQMWTGCLALLLSVYQAFFEKRGFARLFLVVGGLLLGLAAAALPLSLSWRFLPTLGVLKRGEVDMKNYAFPLENWVEAAVPTLFRNLREGPEFCSYWSSRRTTGYEVCFYVGTIPLILACVSACSKPRESSRGRNVWILISAAAIALASMPTWQPVFYKTLLKAPGIGWFRCPARYSLIATLGLSLLAGKGFDTAIDRRRFAAGLALAAFVAILGVDRAVVLAQKSGLVDSFQNGGLGTRIGLACFAWFVGFVVLMFWKKRLAHASVVVVFTLIELSILFFTSTTEWGRHIRIPSESRIMLRLMNEPNVYRVAGRLDDLPVSAGLTAADPYLAARLSGPNLWLARANVRAKLNDPVVKRWLRRYGVSHGVWAEPIPLEAATEVWSAEDQILDFLAPRSRDTPVERRWRVVRYSDPAPPARVALQCFTLESAERIYTELSLADHRDLVFIETKDPLPPRPRGRLASTARVVNFDGRREPSSTTAIVCWSYPALTTKAGPRKSAGGSIRPCSKSTAGSRASGLRDRELRASSSDTFPCSSYQHQSCPLSRPRWASYSFLSDVLGWVLKYRTREFALDAFPDKVV